MSQIEQYQQVERLIPWGTQTNAKRPDADLMDVMPLFIERAEGCRIQDTDGRWFIDYRSALGPIILGYRFPAVEEAVRKQMEKGVLFSMASPIEYEVAEQLSGMIQGMEQVRFVKTGNEANACMVRLTRAFTKRDHIVTIGYHGHSDWFACGEGSVPMWWGAENNGVPKSLNPYVSRIKYGDIAALEQVFAEKGEQIAAVITVPYDWEDNVASDFLQKARLLTTQNGSLLLFDQVLTGFRLATGCAQEYFGIIPDLSSYAKALANGYPLAAFGGKREIMSMLNQVVLTSTYSGETLSLAACLATLKTIESEPVLRHIWDIGIMLRQGFNSLAEKFGIPARTFGLPPALQFRFSTDPEMQRQAWTRFSRLLLEQGIFPSRPFLLNYSHQPTDIQETLDAIEIALQKM